MAARQGGSSTPKQAFDPKQFLKTVGDGRRSVQYQDKDLIFRQGDATDAVGYIEKGSVQITVVSDQGKIAIIGILRAGQFFGEGCLIGQPLYLSSANANEPARVTIINKAAMQQGLQDEPGFSEMFMSFLLTRNGQIEADLVDQLFNSSEKRLARALLVLADFGKDGILEAVIPKISQDDLAARVGTTRARINFFMNKFRTLGLIEYDNDTLKVYSALVDVIVHD